jgi:hypothetical protein
MRRRLPEPWCQFCHKKVGDALVFDYDEHHAILTGIGDGLQPWRSDSRAWGLFSLDWWYYVVARGVTTFLATCILILLWRCA